MTPRLLTRLLALPIALLATASPALAQQQPAAREPHIGYVYPAGGQRGTRFEATVGGQFLQGVCAARVFGDGVTVEVIEHVRPITAKDALLLRDQLAALRARRDVALSTTRPATMPAWTDQQEKELLDIQKKLATFVRKPSSPAIAETVTLIVTIAKTAEPVDREIRLRTQAGLTNPLVFRVGQFNEVSEPPTKNVGEPTRAVPKDERSVPSLPAVVNGQILPGGVDRWRFPARRGQHLVIATSARELIPYLPDAVPGWFQATLALYDPKGREIAYCDDFRFSPDPVLCCTVPADGEYALEVKDAIYRGREDFVYRITIGEIPVVTSMFPLGGQAGSRAAFTLRGFNLPATSLTEDLADKQPGLYVAQARKGAWVANSMRFSVDTLTEVTEKEQDDGAEEAAQLLTVPAIVNGHIGRTGDRDVFRIEARAGEAIIAEVLARRLNSPLDSMLRLVDSTGKQIVFSDDVEDKSAGLETHHADSKLSFTPPSDGTYFLHLTDAQGKGGPDYSYRLRVSAPRPDFALRVVPSSVNLRAGGTAAVTVYALRSEGFAGDIRLSLKNAPAGVALSASRIPAGQDQTRITLTARGARLPEPVPVSIEGRATIGGQETSRPGVPADDLMQAFLYRHLVCAKELLLTGASRGEGAWRTPASVPTSPPQIRGANHAK